MAVVQETLCVRNSETGAMLALMGKPCWTPDACLPSTSSHTPLRMLAGAIRPYGRWPATQERPRVTTDSWSASWPPWQQVGRGLHEGPKQAPQQRPSLEVLVSKPGSGFGPGSSPAPAARVGLLRAVSPNTAVTAIFIYKKNMSYMCTHAHYHRPRGNKAPQECCILVHKVFHLI